MSQHLKIAITLGDCLNEMPKLQSQSIDLILTDLPYGVTQNPADKALPLNNLWTEWKRLLKPDGVIVLTSQFPYSIDLITSNRDWFRYDIVWDKILVTGFLNANRMPLRCHEHILVFSEKAARYYPQKSIGAHNHNTGLRKTFSNSNYGDYNFQNKDCYSSLKYPTSIIRLSKLANPTAVHPTEKPVELAEYLIKTYTQKHDTVLDCCMGVGWSAVACKRLDRNFIGFDINSEYINIAKQRTAAVPAKLDLFTQEVCVE